MQGRHLPRAGEGDSAGSDNVLPVTDPLLAGVTGSTGSGGQQWGGKAMDPAQLGQDTRRSGRATRD